MISTAPKPGEIVTSMSAGAIHELGYSSALPGHCFQGHQQYVSFLIFFYGLNA